MGRYSIAFDKVEASEDLGADLLHHAWYPPPSPVVAGFGSNMTAKSARTRCRRSGGDASVVRVHGTETRRLRSAPIATRAIATPIPMKAESTRLLRHIAISARSAQHRFLITNCLNFGNPQRPEIMAQFVGCRRRYGRRLSLSSTSPSLAATSRSTMKVRRPVAEAQFCRPLPLAASG